MALSKKNEAVATVDEAAEEVVAVVEASEESVLDQPDPEPAVAQTTAVAAPTGQAPATVASGAADAATKLAESGFSGLHIDWTSFPTVVLDNGDFCTSDGQTLDTPRSLNVRLMQSRMRYVLRTNADDDDDAELAYTYNLAELDDAESDLAQRVTKWKEEDGLDFSVKEYIEALAIVVEEESSLAEQMVLLQIPPTSTGRFSGFTTSNLLIKQLEPTGYITRCYAGNKVTKAKKPFVPWAFEFVSKIA